MGADMEKFSAGPMNLGVESQQMQLLPQLLLDFDSYNMTAGIQQGLGPRYGMATIPGQADNETLAGSRLPGLRGAEEANAAPYFSRRSKVYAVLPLSIADPTTNVATTCYAFLLEGGSSNYFDIAITSTVNLAAPNRETISAQIYDGFASPSTDTSEINPEQNLYCESIVTDINGERAAPLVTYLTRAANRYYASAVAASVSNGFVPMRWYMGSVTADPDATHAPNLALQRGTLTVPGGGSTSTAFFGVPAEYNLANFRSIPRRIKIHGLTRDGDFDIDYSLLLPPTTSNITADKRGSNSTVMTLSAITATKDTAGTSYSTVDLALVNDDMTLLDSSYQAILVAQDRPWACLFQSAYQQQRGRFNQWFDLTQHSFDPTTNGVYTEDGVRVPASFLLWPDFLRGSAMSDSFIDATGPSLGDADTGVLEKDTVYEFTYSLYNKRLNYETNVGRPVKIQTGSDDFVALRLWDPTKWVALAQPQTLYATYAINSQRFLPFQFANTTDVAAGGSPRYRGTSNFINFYEYRFYYRAEGTFEWLPALKIDAAQLWFRPSFPIYACTGALAATTGGQPGGFNDYSPLPNDTYIDVKVFNNRAFWCTPKSISFSLQKNFLAYPGRNSLACPQGFFRGMLVHAYPGQAQQASRVVVFGSELIYVGRFNGNRLQTSVQVSPDATGVFDVEGSDFVLDPWTSITAFSYRSAVSADGILYYWGPQGVYRDDGLAIPTKISSAIEPDIFQVYDTGLPDQIHATYNSTTKEIIWVYPIPGGGTTRMLIYNVGTEQQNASGIGSFNLGRFNGQLDWMQNLNVETAAGTSGKRLISGVRVSELTTIQRAYFFDYRNRSGDMIPKRDFVVKTVTTPSTGTRRLTLAAGYDAATLAGFGVGEYVAIQQFNSYTGQTTGTDLIGVISAVNSGAGTVDFTLPTGAVLPNVSLTYNQFFPFWHGNAGGAGFNNFPYKLTTNYWAPAGINGYFFWLYAYLLSKVNLWKTNLTTTVSPRISYRTPTSLAFQTDQLTLTDNSDENWQLYHPLAPGNDNAEGQAIRFVISGSQLGHEWVLQYLEAHARNIEFGGDPLKRFEG